MQSKPVLPKARPSAEFGHMHLSLFYRRVLAIRPEGVEHRGKIYGPEQIRAVDVWQEPFPGIGHVPDAKLLPRARVKFSDGVSVLLHGDALVKRGGRLATGYTSEFNELVAHLLALRRTQLRGYKDHHRDN